MTAPPDSVPLPLRLLFWESTAKCNLSCAHCRRLDADAGADELSMAEALTLIDSAASLGKPIFVFSGGEPLLRPDWPALADYAHSRGLPTALATNGTLVDDRVAGQIGAAGFHRVSVSLDGADAATHDAIRGRSGAFDAALAGVASLRKAGVPVQINASLNAGNVGQLDALHGLAREAGAVALHLFVLVPVGCGMAFAADNQLTGEQVEEVLEWLCARQADCELELKATCAPQYHRVAGRWLERNSQAAGAERIASSLRGRGCLAGVGVAFVSHTGEVFPCGYLPVSCGNVRQRPLSDIWTDSDVFARLRNFDLLSGKCGRCEYKAVCGGCRARAFAATGDYLTAEPACQHVPSTGG